MSHKNWLETEATVFTCGVQDHYEPQDGGFKDYIVTFSYEINGQMYSGEFHSAKPWTEGSKFTIHYDPEDPSRNSKHDSVSDRRFNFIVIPIIIALTALFFWLKSIYWP